MTDTETSLTDTLIASKRVVIKIGSALLVNIRNGAINRGWLDALAADIDRLRKRGTDVVIVSSGAIGLGRARLGLRGETLNLEQKQACAAAGQAQLTQSYEDALAPFGYVTAQTLLTMPDTENRRRWLNGRRTLKTLLGLGAIPIVNENDTVSTAEIRYGDNDRLAARVAQMCGADILLLLSDIDGLYTADPRGNSEAVHIPVVDEITHEIEAMGGGENPDAGVGTGGMATKIAAARIAVAAGCHVIVTRGDLTRPITALEAGGKATRFTAQIDPFTARKQWIVGTLNHAGTITVDAGAAQALLKGNSLLPAGVTGISGTFFKGDPVAIEDADGHKIACGLTAYDSEDALRIAGIKSQDIIATLGYSAGASLIHADDLALL